MSKSRKKKPKNSKSKKHDERLGTHKSSGKKRTLSHEPLSFLFHSNKPSRFNAILYEIDKTILGRIISLIMFFGTVLAIIQFFQHNEGTFMATVNGEEVRYSSFNRNILVYFDKDSANLLKTKVFPKISNPSRYALNDVNLKYKVYADSSANISYRTDYSVQELLDDEGVTYKEVTYEKEKIKQGDTAPLPFRSFVMKDRGEARIDLYATYRGYKKPFLYHANIFTKKICQEETQLFESIFKDAYFFLDSNNYIDDIDLLMLDKDTFPYYENLTAALLQEKIDSYKDTPLPSDSSEMLADLTLPTYYIIVGSGDSIVEIIGPDNSVVEIPADSIIHSRHRRQLFFVRLRDSAGMQLADTFKYGGTIYPTQEEIVKNEYFTINDKPDNKSTPWYMYIVAILLDIVFLIVISWLIRRILHYNKNQNTLLFVFEIIVTGFLSYIALMFSLRILFVTFQETSFLWAPLAFLYTMLFGLLIITSLFEKDDIDRYGPVMSSKNHNMPEFNTTVHYNISIDEKWWRRLFGYNRYGGHSESIDHPSQVIVTIIWAVFIVVIFIIISRIF